MTLDLDAMICNVCRATRPDAMIAVAKRPGPIPAAIWNIWYCVDRPACVEYATADGQWTDAAEWWRVEVPVENVDSDDFNRMAEIVQAMPYDAMWVSIQGVSVAIVRLAAGTAVAAGRHAMAALRAGGAQVDTETRPAIVTARRSG